MEIILAIAISIIVFGFIFYFLTTLSVHKDMNTVPRLLDDFNYTNTYCQLKDDYKNISIFRDVDFGKYISTSTPITSINIYNKNFLILTTNSASTTEPDIFLFDLSNMNLVRSINTGPGINDSVLHGNYLYALNNSVNSHVQTFMISNADIKVAGDLKIQELSSSYAMPKSISLIYASSSMLIVGSEKNNKGRELFFIELYNNIPGYIFNAIEIDGQVNDIYHDKYIYIATANDNELQVFDIDGNLVSIYNADLTLGNGKSVYVAYPYIFLGRTVASFELNVLTLDKNIMSFFKKYSVQGTVDYIEPLKNNYLFITNYSPGELLFMNKNMAVLGKVNIPSRVNAYTCINDTILISNIINNKSHILWLK